MLHQARSAVDAAPQPVDRLDAGIFVLRARQGLDEQIARLQRELAELRAERATWERRVSLLRPASIDPDLLDERARAQLEYIDSRELTFRLRQP